MMKWIFVCMIVISTLFGALNGRIGDVSNALIQGSGNAVTLVISLMGAMCLWSGVMKVADEAGLTNMVAKLLSPITKHLFKGLDTDSPAMKAISMNITANLLGLGNAATPLGIEAMRRMAEDEKIKDTASNNMITFVGFDSINSYNDISASAKSRRYCTDGHSSRYFAILGSIIELWRYDVQSAGTFSC